MGKVYMCVVLFYCVVFLLMSRAVKRISNRHSRQKEAFRAGLLNSQPWIFPVLYTICRKGSV